MARPRSEPGLELLNLPGCTCGSRQSQSCTRIDSFMTPIFTLSTPSSAFGVATTLSASERFSQATPKMEY
jgi:hypothetical protein